MKYQAQKDFYGDQNTLLFAKGAILTEEDLVKHPWLRKSLRSGTITEVLETPDTVWKNLLEEDMF